MHVVASLLLPLQENNFNQFSLKSFLFHTTTNNNNQKHATPLPCSVPQNVHVSMFQRNPLHHKMIQSRSWPDADCWGLSWPSQLHVGVFEQLFCPYAHLFQSFSCTVWWNVSWHSDQNLHHLEYKNSTNFFKHFTSSLMFIPTFFGGHLLGLILVEEDFLGQLSESWNYFNRGSDELWKKIFSGIFRLIRDVFCMFFYDLLEWTVLIWLWFENFFPLNKSGVEFVGDC